MSQLVLSSAFQRQLKRLIRKDPRLRSKVAKTLKLLIKSIDSPSLRLHKLSGEENWSVSVTSDIRIIIHRVEGKVYCLRIGTHDQVY